MEPEKNLFTKEFEMDRLDHIQYTVESTMQGDTDMFRNDKVRMEGTLAAKIQDVVLMRPLGESWECNHLVNLCGR